jgi:hypothetical protein
MKKFIVLAAAILAIGLAAMGANAASKSHGKSSARPHSNQVRSSAKAPNSHGGGAQKKTHSSKASTVRKQSGVHATFPAVPASAKPQAKNLPWKPAPMMSVKKTPGPLNGSRDALALFDYSGPTLQQVTGYSPPSPQTVLQNVQGAGQNAASYVTSRLPSGGGSGVSFGGAASTMNHHVVSGGRNGEILGTSAPAISAGGAILRPASSLSPWGSGSGVPKPQHPSWMAPIPTSPSQWSQAGQPILSPLPNPIITAQAGQQRAGNWWNQHIRDPWVDFVDRPAQWLKQENEWGKKQQAKIVDAASKIPDAYTGDQYTYQQGAQISKSQYGANAISVTSADGGAVGYPINPAMEGKNVTITMYVVGDPSQVYLAIANQKGVVVASSKLTNGVIKNVPINGQLVPVRQLQFNVNIPSDGLGYGGMNSTGDFLATLQLRPGAQIDILGETAKRSN